MTRHDIASELEGAASQIGDMSRADLQVLLRRAALMLRNVTGLVLEPRVEESLAGLAEERAEPTCAAGTDGVTHAGHSRTICHQRRRTVRCKGSAPWRGRCSGEL